MFKKRLSIVLDAITHHLRQNLRSLRRDAGTATFVIAIIGLGIGATATVFSVVNTLLIRPLPFESPDRLVWISNGDWGRTQDLSSKSAQVAYVIGLREQSQTLSDVAGYYLFDRAGDHVLTGGGEPERLTRLQVTENFLEVLGVQPVLGRTFIPEEALSRRHTAVILSHDFWRRRLGEDSGVVGTTITIDGEPVTVVGVLPATFDFPSIFAPGTRVDFVAPFPLTEETNRIGNTLALVGRLEPGATVAAAQAEADVIAERTRSAALNTFSPWIQPLREHISGSFRPLSFLLIGSVGLLMLLVCANLANLLLARGATRRRELAVRAALGAGRRRLMLQMLTESAILASGGAILGLVLAIGATRGLAAANINVPLLAQVQVDGAVLAFTLVAAGLTAVLFGVAPAVLTSSGALHDDLAGGGRGASESRQHASLRGALVVAEVGLACVLLIGAGLLARSFIEILRTDLGFQPRRAIMLRVDPSTRFSDAESRVAYYDEVLRRARSVPGVEAVGLTDALPVVFNRRWCVRPVDVAPEPDSACPSPYVRVVSEDYVRAMGLSLAAGRDFTVDDHARSRSVALVNDAFVRQVWPGEVEVDVVGREVRASPRQFEVVGLTRGTRYLSPDQEPGPEVFFTMRQMPDFAQVYVVARSTRPLADLVASFRAALRPLDPNLPVTEVRVVQEIIDRSISPRRFVAILLAGFAGFAGFALLLASLGIYAVISHSVARRTKEMAIRLAVGASPGRLRRRILLETMQLVSVGMAIGMLAAWNLGRAVQGLLFGVTPTDPLTFLTVFAGLFCVAGLAALVPARRAARLDPMEVIRADL